jgi:hypothetical protein
MPDFVPQQNQVIAWTLLAQVVGNMSKVQLRQDLRSLLLAPILDSDLPTSRSDCALLYLFI